MSNMPTQWTAVERHTEKIGCNLYCMNASGHIRKNGSKVNYIDDGRRTEKA